MQPILHHYPPSLFSEKIRTLLGYLKIDWQSVVIPSIMPRPNLTPLSGGYRKTPILQIGANIYCDTEIISRKLAALGGNESLYAPGFAAEKIARWADTELFLTSVALNFRPEAIGGQMGQLTDVSLEEFQKDRAAFSSGATISIAEPASAVASFESTLESLESSLQSPFLFGDKPSIADFSVYHCLWFVAGNSINLPMIEKNANVLGYLNRMRTIGHGNFTEIPSEDALAIGTEATPVVPDNANVDQALAGNLKAGDAVTVTPNDSGRIPVSGHLISWRTNEVVITRDDPTASAIMVHFPNHGYTVAPT